MQNYVYVVDNRDHALLNPRLPQVDEKCAWARVAADGLRRVGLPAIWISPERAFAAKFQPDPREWVVVSPQPRERNASLVRLMQANRHAAIAIAPGGAQLDLLPSLLQDGLVDVVHLSIDKLQAATGCYDAEKALRQLGGFNPHVVIVATNAQTAIATVGGELCRQPAFRLKSSVCGEGKSAAFFAAFLATLIETSDLRRALIAGHANGAAVASSWDTTKALLNRQQLDEFVEPVLAEPPVKGNRLLTRVMVAAGLLATLIGFTLLAAGAL